MTMVPFNIQIVPQFQKQIAQIALKAAAPGRNQNAQANTQDKNESDAFADKFGGGGQGGRDADASARKVRDKMGVCISATRSVPGMVFNWTKTKAARGNTIAAAVETALEDVNSDKFTVIKEALESEYENYKPLGCPRRPVLRKIVECIQEIERNRSNITGIALAKPEGRVMESDSADETAFGGKSASPNDAFGGGDFGGSGGSPDALASDCIRTLNQLGGINFRFTSSAEYIGQNISAMVATALSSAWTGRAKPSAGQISGLRLAIKSEADNFKPSSSAAVGVLYALAECLGRYEKSL